MAGTRHTADKLGVDARQRRLDTIGRPSAGLHHHHHYKHYLHHHCQAPQRPRPQVARRARPPRTHTHSLALSPQTPPSPSPARAFHLHPPSLPPKLQAIQLFLPRPVAVVYACFSAAVFLAQTPPPHLPPQTGLAPPFSAFLSPPAPQTFLSAFIKRHRQSCAHCSFFPLFLLLASPPPLIPSPRAICSPCPRPAVPHGVQQPRLPPG